MKKLSTNIKRALYSAAAAIGCLLAWVKIMGISVSGTENTYVIILSIAAGIAALLAFFAEQNKSESPTVLYGLVGGYGVAICAYAAYTYYTTFSEMNKAMDALSALMGEGSGKSSFLSQLQVVGIGYWLTLAGSVMLLVSSFSPASPPAADTPESHYERSQTEDKAEIKTGEKKEKVKQWLKDNPTMTLNDYFKLRRDK